MKYGSAPARVTVLARPRIASRNVQLVPAQTGLDRAFSSAWQGERAFRPVMFKPA